MNPRSTSKLKILNSLVIISVFFVGRNSQVLKQTNLHLEKPFENAPPNSDIEPSTHKFDIIAHDVYNRASKLENLRREPFKLEGNNWERGSGGLDDADRQTLFDLYHDADSVFEWGLGESTKIAAKVGVPRYAGIDSDPAWVQQARVQAGMDHFRFSYADIGNTTAWGYASNDKLQKIALNYQVAPLLVEQKPFDFYLSDGRYRVACACVGFLHAMKYGADLERVRVGIHDNDRNWRRGCDVLLEIGHSVVKNRKLWVYKLKSGITEEQVFKLWLKYVDNSI
mmetsp:Transcript_886/g.1403  ORF Transcript_886/g.1403 Transcript_886/m.1403 type:complete len:282 (-) Transcript_886:36-881(-)